MSAYFTRAEAEALLPRITPLLEEIRLLRRAQLVHEQALADDRAKVAGNGHLPPASVDQHRVEMSQAEQQIARVVQAIDTLGIIVKDLDSGLVDFPSLRDGREVYLCWLLGEPHVAWWHEIADGFAGRTPLEDDEW